MSDAIRIAFAAQLNPITSFSHSQLARISNWTDKEVSAAVVFRLQFWNGCHEYPHYLRRVVLARIVGWLRSIAAKCSGNITQRVKATSI